MLKPQHLNVFFFIFSEPFISSPKAPLEEEGNCRRSSHRSKETAKIDFLFNLNLNA